MEEDKKWLETLLLDAEDFELIAKLAKLLPVIRMAEQMRVMTADFDGGHRGNTELPIRALAILK